MLATTPPDDKKEAAPIAAVRAKIALAAEAAALGDPAEFERRLAADPEGSSRRASIWR